MVSVLLQQFCSHSKTPVSDAIFKMTNKRYKGMTKRERLRAGEYYSKSENKI